MGARLEDRIAIVTGGSRGIGAAIARAFAREGARVVIASRKQEGLDQAATEINAHHPGSVHPRACHVGHAERIGELVDWTEKTLGTPTILVNNAATNPYFGPLMGVTESLWDKTFEINLKGYFEMTRQVAQHLMAHKIGGSVINVASIAGLRGSPLQGVYAMTKAAVISFTQTLSIELASAGIRLNAIAPGLVDTRLASAITGSDDLRRYFTDRAPLDRYAQPEEIAGLAVFLASDESSFVTGQTICADGGWSIA